MSFEALLSMLVLLAILSYLPRDGVSYGHTVAYLHAQDIAETFYLAGGYTAVYTDLKEGTHHTEALMNRIRTTFSVCVDFSVEGLSLPDTCEKPHAVNVTRFIFIPSEDSDKVAQASFVLHYG